MVPIADNCVYSVRFHPLNGLTRIMKKRCGWVNGNQTSELYIDYHDREWGVPLHDDKQLFEFLILEGAQAGLNWATILNKRENYRQAYQQFDPKKVAKFTDKQQQKLLENPGIIRNRLKVTASIVNAQQFLNVQKEFGSFDSYVWQFVAGKTIQNKWKSLADIPATTPESEQMSHDLKKRGFKFVGPTICYAFMQAVGMVNDHTTHCFRYKELS